MILPDDLKADLANYIANYVSTNETTPELKKYLEDISNEKQELPSNLEEENNVLRGAGFYKADNGELLFAERFVKNKDYELYIEKKYDYKYPIGGWTYFNNESDAKILLNK